MLIKVAVTLFKIVGKKKSRWQYKMRYIHSTQTSLLFTHNENLDSRTCVLQIKFSEGALLCQYLRMPLWLAISRRKKNHTSKTIINTHFLCAMAY